MVVNLSPTTASAAESLCSLRFASQLNRVELGRAVKHCFIEPKTAPSQTAPNPGRVEEVPAPRMNTSSTSEVNTSRSMKRPLQSISRGIESDLENRPGNLYLGQFPAHQYSSARLTTNGAKRFRQTPFDYQRESVSAHGYSFVSGVERSVSLREKRGVPKKASRSVNSAGWR